MSELIRNRPSSQEPVFDLMKVEVDIGTYENESGAGEVRQRKKRSSVVVVNLRKQLKKDSRFISLLCSKSVKPTGAILQTPKCNFNVLSVPRLDFSSEDSCVTPFHNTMLRTIQTPVSVGIGKYPSQVSSKKATPRKSRKSMSGSPVKLLLKRKPRGILRTMPNPEPFKMEFQQKLKKRSLHSETSNFRLFDTREILNITNGSFAFN